MKKYKIIADGRRPNEEYIAILNDDGSIHRVASGYYDYKKNIYRLYPCNYGSYSTISTRLNVNAFEVQGR